MASETEKIENKDYLLLEEIVKIYFQEFLHNNQEDIFDKQKIYTLSKTSQLNNESELSIEDELKKSLKRIERLKALSKNLKTPIYKDTNKEIYELTRKIIDIEIDVQALKENNIKLSEILFSQITSYGAKKTYQFIPVNIFLDTDDPNKIYSTYQAILDFLNSIRFETIIDFPEKKGSWIKRIVSKSKEIMTSEEVSDRMKEVEYAVEVNTILKPQSEVEKNQSEALLNILKGLEGIPNSIIRIGSLLVVKVTNHEGEMNVQVRTLSIKELHLLNKHPELLNKPKHILSDLANLLDNIEKDI